MSAEAADISRLEHSLWRTETRYDPLYMERLVSAGFREFGKSGRRYTRDDIIADTSEDAKIAAVLHNLTCDPVTEDVTLVTYICELDRGGKSEWSNRSSLWQKTSGKWQLHFHQGTPTEALT
ncbi:MAG: DUF4440 domain-containing protein [Pseudomonadota bacterium]